MVMPFFRGEPVTIVRTVYGALNPEWNIAEESTVTFEVEAVLAYRTSRTMKNAMGEVLSGEMKIIFDHGTDVQPGDLFIVRNTVWEIDGFPNIVPADLFSNLMIESPVVVDIVKSQGIVKPEVVFRDEAVTGR